MPEPLFTKQDVALIRLFQQGIEGVADADDIADSLARFGPDYPLVPDEINLKVKHYSQIVSLSTRIERWLEMVRQHPYVVFAND